MKERLGVRGLMNGNTERAHRALSRVCIPKKRKRKSVSSDKKKMLKYLNSETNIYGILEMYIYICV